MNHDSRKNVEKIHNKIQPNKWRQAETRRNGIYYIITFTKKGICQNTQKKTIKDMNHNLKPFRLNKSYCWFFYAWNYEHICVLTLYAPISQNGQTHSNHSSANLSVFDHFAGLALKGLTGRLFEAKIISTGLQLREPRHAWNIAWITA